MRVATGRRSSRRPTIVSPRATAPSGPPLVALRSVVGNNLVDSTGRSSNRIRHSEITTSASRVGRPGRGKSAPARRPNAVCSGSRQGRQTRSRRSGTGPIRWWSPANASSIAPWTPAERDPTPGRMSDGEDALPACTLEASDQRGTRVRSAASELEIGTRVAHAAALRDVLAQRCAFARSPRTPRTDGVRGSSPRVGFADGAECGD
jgi:hypothetical protein